MMSGKFKGMLKGAGLTAAVALGVFMFAGTSNAQYGGYGQAPYYGNGGYGNNGYYNNNERKKLEKAYDKGIKDGRKQGERDAKNGYRSNGNYGNNGNYNRGGGVFGGIFSGRNGREQQAYNDGYRQGYQEGFSRYRNNNRNRGWNNRRSTWPF